MREIAFLTALITLMGCATATSGTNNIVVRSDCPIGSLVCNPNARTEYVPLESTEGAQQCRANFRAVNQIIATCGMSETGDCADLRTSVAAWERGLHPEFLTFEARSDERIQSDCLLVMTSMTSAATAQHVNEFFTLLELPEVQGVTTVGSNNPYTDSPLQSQRLVN